ncbi:phosphate/phosphite/phosphonate ABC transporter substrate-binding protein [Luteimonas dalianensis]|uniref:phosphate/phosphite/phosphonate ABC transporter substrate-binding protein n=1 Tax=Luteimonas dalianensis TaxID=1148196 RepID=UPI003BF1E864
MSTARVRLSHLFGLLCAGLLAAFSAVAEDGVLVLGRISDDPARHYAQLQPLLDYVVPKMADVGIREGRILMARDAQQMMSYLRRGRVHWVTETAAASMLLQERTGAQPLLLTERSGVSHYRTVFFVRRDSGIEALEELQGRTVAFQVRTSTSAYFVPATELLARGLAMEILLSPRDEPSVDSVGYLFAGSEANITTWVHKGLVDAGAMSDLDWENPRATPPAYRRDLVLIHQTPAFPRAVELTGPDMAPRVRERLREVLLEAAADPQASEALLHFFRTTGFLPIDEGAAGQLEYLRNAVLRVSEEVE